MAVSKYQKFTFETIHRSQIKNAEYNPRIIDKEARKRLKKSLKDHGLVQGLTWNKRTGNLVGGHQRLSLLDSLERTEDYSLTVCVVDVDEKEEAILNVQLIYIDKEGNERCMSLPAHECIFLSEVQNISEPDYAIRYYRVEDIYGKKKWHVELFDDTYIHIYEGQINALEEIEIRPHLFDLCPLQGIANNREMLSDAEKVMTLIDDFDKVFSDNSNEVESFVHA